MNSKYLSLGILLTTPATPLVAYCEVYLSEDQALKSTFAEEGFLQKKIELSPEEVKIIEEKSGQNVRSTSLRIWYNSKTKNLLFVDQVIGKHEFITFAVGIDRLGQVKGIEILEYRESYGQQVKDELWRKQFVGKTASATLKVGEDIKNISGATLSSTHVTNGVKRLIFSYEQIKNRL